MTSIGDTLRRERERRHLELDQVSRELKISHRFLEAIEKEDFDQLPAGVFAKSFVRQYARMLGLDEEEAANEVQRALVPAPTVPQFAASSPSRNQGCAASGVLRPKSGVVAARPRPAEFFMEFSPARPGAGGS